MKAKNVHTAMVDPFFPEPPQTITVPLLWDKYAYTNSVAQMTINRTCSRNHRTFRYESMQQTEATKTAQVFLESLTKLLIHQPQQHA